MRPPAPTSRFARALLALGFWLLAAQAALATGPDAAAILVSTSGEVEIRTSDGSSRDVAPGAILHTGDRVRTGPDGSAAIRLADESLVRVNRSSVFTLQEVARRGLLATGLQRVRAALQGGTSSYRLERGELWIRNNHPGAQVDIHTPTLSAGIRGTELNVRIDEAQGVIVSVLEGRAWGRSPYGEIVAETGEQIVAPPGAAPFKRVMLRPRDAVQWTVPVPDLFPLDALTAGLPAAAREPAMQALSELRRGRRNAAAEHAATALRAAPGSIRIETLAAVIALYRGEALDAHRRLVALAEQAPEEAIPWQALTLSALVIDDKPTARAASARTVEIAPDSATAWVLAGYVEQAHFDLEAAGRAYERALALDPQHLTALVGKARLEFGSDRNEDAWRTTERARALAPDDPEVLNLSGFLLLARREAEAARSRFEQALQRDPTLAEPWLGLSIAAMRAGSEEEAFAAISSAVALDPARALYLGYWGRMLQQVGRIDEAMVVLASASRSDPLDPSPHYYRAVILNDLNRPGESIEELHRAIALNDHRAVYRSRFLLDRDLAFRNVDLSYLYGRLGLTAWAEHQALTSVKQDVLNFAGHVFYAGALGGRDERARGFATEALLGRILQPANINTFNTFNDYTTFFEQPGTSGSAGVTVGNHGTRRAELFAYHAEPAHSLVYSGSLSGFGTDGWRGTNSDRGGGAILRMKWEPSTLDNLTVSLRHNRRRMRDPEQPFSDTYAGDRLDRDTSRSTTFEAGWHRRLGARTHLLAVVSANNLDFDSRCHDREDFPVVEDVPSELVTLTQGRNGRNSRNAQAMVMHQADAHQLSGGLTWYEARQSTLSTTDYALLVFDESIPLPDVSERHARRHRVRYTNAFLQDIWNLSPRWSLEGAVHWDRMQTGNLFAGTRWTVETISPRVGLAWRPTPHDTVRLAAFRYLVPFTFTRLDPADIAGIPVYRAAEEGSRVHERALTWEHGWSSGFLSAGVFSLRRESVQYFDFGEGRYRVDYRGRTRGAEIALDQIVNLRTGFAARYRHLDVRDDFYADLDRREHLLALGVRWVDPSGYSAGVSGTWRKLDFRSSRRNQSIFLADADLSYELPGKRGTVSLAVRNLFDRRFDWVVDQFIFTGRVPAREVALSVSLNF